MYKTLFLILMAFVLTGFTVGCQSKESTMAKQDAKTMAIKDGDVSSEEASEEQTNPEKKNEEKGKIFAADVESDTEMGKILSVGDEKTTGDVTVKLVAVQEFRPEYIQASQDRFIAVTIAITNDGKEPLEISSLKHLTLLAKDEPQDLAVIEGVSELGKEIPPGKTLSGQVVYDCVDAEQYNLIFRFGDETPVTWEISPKDLTDK